jgi:hypothetical protein
MKKKQFSPVLLLGITIIVLLAIFLVKSIFFAPKQLAKKVVDTFYAYESEGDFSESWNLFHPDMKVRWKKSVYINDRAHVFMGHFGAETFDYTIEYVDTVNGWQMSKGLKPVKLAYKFHVFQIYQGKYGRFTFKQEVYVVNHKDEWEILWDYNQ